MAKRHDPPPLEPHQFRSADEIDQCIEKLKRRIREVQGVDLLAAVRDENGADDVVESNIRETVRDVFGPQSPEFQEHQYIRIWAGAHYMGMDRREVLDAKERGRRKVMAVIEGLISRLTEKKQDLLSAAPTPSSCFERLNLHPRILDVSQELLTDGYHWEAVFAAAKALVNYVKDRSGGHHLDGAPLMRAVFSKNDPILAFNALANQTDLDEQEGMMHLFEGAVLGIRNPGGHGFPEGSEQRAIEYIGLLSLLAYRTQEAQKRKKP